MLAGFLQSGEFSAVEANLRETLKFFAHSNDRGAIVESDRNLMVYSGIDYGVFNTVTLKAPVESESDLHDHISEAEAYFRGLGARWSFWICQDLLSPFVARRLRRICESRRLRLLSEPPGMLLNSLQPVRRFPPELLVREVETDQDRLAFSGILSTTFDLPYPICRDVYAAERSWGKGYRGWVAWVNGEPVATTACVVAADVIGIYSVGTMPNWRRHGVAEALMRQVLGQVSTETGIEQSILQSTIDGYRIYQRMGYRRVTQFSIFLTSP